MDSIFITFYALHSAYKLNHTFNLEDSVSVGANENLMASKGHTGATARARSFNEDASRDSMLNQFKMYAEVFRLLGWIRSSSSQDRTTYSITFLGNLVPTAKNPTLLLEQSLLALSFPNFASKVLFKNRVFPFQDLLKTMHLLDNAGTRDEFLIGPLALNDSNDEEEFYSMIDQIRSIRNKSTVKERAAELELELDKLISEITPNKNTARNYTRIPLSALKLIWCSEYDEVPLYPRNTTILILNENGKKVADWLMTNAFYRPHCDSVVKLPLSQIKAISIFGLIHFLKRASFDVTSLELLAEPLKYDLLNVPGYTTNQEILFNPYQTLSPELLNKVFEDLIPDLVKEVPIVEYLAKESPISFIKKPLMPESNIQCIQNFENHYTGESEVLNLIKNVAEKITSEREASMQIVTKYRNANQDIFYPAIAEIFTELGFSCEKSRAGVTGLRWDAFIKEPFNIPIEIKSPGEELYIQVKAIRQALENKVILQSRLIYGGSNQDTTSLVVGYFAPNERAEAGELIQDIKTAFGINIGIIDFQSLVRLLIRKYRLGVVPDKEQLRTLYGIINVD